MKTYIDVRGAARGEHGVLSHLKTMQGRYMKKVRELPAGANLSMSQTPEYQEYLRTCIAEEGQVTLVKAFLDGKEDDGLPLWDLDYEVLRDCLKPLPTNLDNLDSKHSIWEEGADVCHSYGKLTQRGLIRWTLQSGKVGSWLMAVLTEQGRAAIPSNK